MKLRVLGAAALREPRIWLPPPWHFETPSAWASATRST